MIFFKNSIIKALGEYLMFNIILLLAVIFVGFVYFKQILILLIISWGIIFVTSLFIVLKFNKNKKVDNFLNVYLLYTSIKIFACLLFLIFLKIFLKTLYLKHIAIFMLSMYMLNLIFEVLSILKFKN